MNLSKLGLNYQQNMEEIKKKVNTEDKIII